MPADIVSVAAQLGPLVDKLGVIGLLIAAVVGLIFERLRLVKQAAKTFRQRDKARLVSERYRADIAAAGRQVPDTSDIEKEFADAEA